MTDTVQEEPENPAAKKARDIIGIGSRIVLRAEKVDGSFGPPRSYELANKTCPSGTFYRIGPENRLYKALLGKLTIPQVMRVPDGRSIKVERVIQPKNN